MSSATRGKIMTTSSRRKFLGLAALNLAAVACSSTSLKKTGDAATTPDLGRTDLAARDGRVDVAGADMAGPDLANPDLPALDTLLDGKDTLIVADLPAGEDTLIVADLPAGNDTSLADLPPSAADARASDVHAADVPPGDGVPRDGPADGLWGCMLDAGGAPGCNDNPNSAAVMGTCQPDGTCVCKSSYVINPSTGRCMYPLRDASIFSDTSAAAACTGEYNACGCGCCSAAPRDVGCYYPSLGETIAAITAQDQAIKSGSSCTSSGCSAGVRYVCCVEPAPESPSSATYVATGYSGGLDHVTIAKSGSDCATLSFARPLTGTSPALKITMPSSWGVASSGFGTCSDASITDPAKGGVGTFAVRASGSDCLADLHVTLFAFAADGTVRSSRLDIDGIVVTGLSGSLCR